MKLHRFSLFIFLILTTTVFSEPIRLAGEIELPVVDYWLMNPSGETYPFQLITEDEEAELLIFRSVIPEVEAITDNVTLKSAVDLVIEDIVLSLPEGKLITNTAFHKEHYVNFILDFSSIDSATGLDINHRLAGYIYRHPEGHQLLFTLWGKTVPGALAIYSDDLVYMQDNFIFIGPYTTDVYNLGYSPNYYFVVGLLFILIILIFILARRKKVTGQ